MSAPKPVDLAANLWIVALAAGVFETVLAVTGLLMDGTATFGSIAAGVGLRVVVTAAAFFLTVRLRRGQNWARLALTGLLGVLGTLSLVIDPIQYLLDGGSIGAMIAQADAMDLAFGASRVVHLAAVFSALALMFRPAANAYFRTRSAAA